MAVPTTAGLGNEFFRELQRQHHVYLPPHVENILKKMGYYCHRSLAKLNSDKFQEIESIMVNVFASDRFFDNMTECERVELFGPVFAACPSTFQLLPGERDLILAAIEASKKVVLKLDTPKVKNKRQAQVSTTSFEGPPTVASPSTSILVPIPNESIVPIKSEISPRRVGRSLDSLVVNWIKNCTKKLNFTANDYIAVEEGDRGKVQCLLCKTVKISITKDSKGYWKLANFSRHVVLHHSANPSNFDNHLQRLMANLDPMQNKMGDQDGGSEDDGHDSQLMDDSLHVPIVELSEPAEGEVYYPEVPTPERDVVKTERAHSTGRISVKRTLTDYPEERDVKLPRPDMYMDPRVMKAQHHDHYSEETDVKVPPEDLVMPRQEQDYGPPEILRQLELLNKSASGYMKHPSGLHH